MVPVSEGCGPGTAWSGVWIKSPRCPADEALVVYGASQAARYVLLTCGVPGGMDLVRVRGAHVSEGD